MNQLPSQWVDSLFARLSVRYGQDWLRKWEGLDIAAVKADWAEELGPMAQNPEAIRFGLANLPEDKPPTVAQFRAICNRRPDAYVPKLAGPRDPAPPNLRPHVKQVIGGGARGPKAWAWDLKEREERGRGLTKFQRDAWRDALAVELLSVQQGDAA